MILFLSLIMAFLYIGLGIAMISGISAMMQIGNNINNLMLLSSFKKMNIFNQIYQVMIGGLWIF